MRFPYQLLLLELTLLRTGMSYSGKFNQETYCQGLIAGYVAGAERNFKESERLYALLDNCCEYYEKPFPCAQNAGPQMPTWLLL